MNKFEEDKNTKKPIRKAEEANMTDKIRKEQTSKPNELLKSRKFIKVETQDENYKEPVEKKDNDEAYVEDDDDSDYNEEIDHNKEWVDQMNEIVTLEQILDKAEPKEGDKKAEETVKTEKEI